MEVRKAPGEAESVMTITYLVTKSLYTRLPATRCWPLLLCMYMYLKERIDHRVISRVSLSPEL